MKTRIAILSLLLVGVLLPARAQHRLAVHPESQLWIEGRSTLDGFTCRSEAVEGSGVLEAGPRAEVRVRVATFDCGRRQMNRDMHQALKAAVHPEIRFDLLDAEAMALPERAEDAYRFRVAGWLTVAGTTRYVETTAHGQRLADGRYRVWGSQPLLMSDFGIAPPTGLLGLVRAHDRIRVRFDLVAALLLQPSTRSHSTQ